MWATMRGEIESRCIARGLRFEAVEHHSAPASPCAPWLQEAVVAGIRSTGDESPLGLWSRAGHDAMAMAAVADTGMLFLRCFDGISHHPAEDVREVDVARGLDAFEETVLEVARLHDGRTLASPVGR